ncbi:uncharacterized protein LOC123430369 [Hordeum vulgare subsp. vulgare]|nr:uncharacterized protein LOC123430369 [Hordeum vulgare subsp. vulgare]KAI5014874.1 hypothetical protein ZWY2020_056264 [Hordeum vulgare]
MGSIKRQEYSFDDDDDNFYVQDDDDLLEAPTLSSEQMARAREEALYVLKTKSPEEAFKIFTEGSFYKIDVPLLGPEQEGKAPTTATPPTAPSNGKEHPQTTMAPARK